MVKEAFSNLSVREKQVLASLIAHYIASADPVGSRVIANKFMTDLSPATIRNTLQDLEELGLLSQPHTSAGRVPTDLGYRVYVDYLLQPNQLTQNAKDNIRQQILKEGRGINEILGQTCRVLSEITTQLGVTIAPKFDAGVLKRLELISISKDKIMAVVVVQSGLARSVIIEIEAAVSDQLLHEVEDVLNERLAGLTLGEVRESISRRLSDISGKGRLINILIDSKEKIWSESLTDEIHLSGADRLVTKPEFSNQEKLSDLLKVLENGKVLTEFLRNQEEEGLVITIGKENRLVEVMNCSLVTSSYNVGKIKGTVGIIGPTRMAYSQLVSVVEYTARTITEVLSGMDEK
ncbi:MAG TPA: heat-inducible transcriptional repressor HrcA [candidate division Zixibacteria bacterium]|nr:heat-inducible transcriptional repressor HrcA [candidate division Zixibacteria bacterium]